MLRAYCCDIQLCELLVPLKLSGAILNPERYYFLHAWRLSSDDDG